AVHRRGGHQLLLHRAARGGGRAGAQGDLPAHRRRRAAALPPIPQEPRPLPGAGADGALGPPEDRARPGRRVGRRRARLRLLRRQRGGSAVPPPRLQPRLRPPRLCALPAAPCRARGGDAAEGGGADPEWPALPSRQRLCVAGGALPRGPARQNGGVNYWVYILASRPYGTLYVGVTSDLVRRIWEHKCKAVPGFTAKYDVDHLVWFEAYATAEARSVERSRSKSGNEIGR